MRQAWRDARRTVLSFDSAADMTANRFGAVVLYDSNTVGLTTGTADTVPAATIGFQENFPESGAAASIRVCVAGATKAIANGAFTAGAALMIATNTAEVKAAASAGANVIGYALETAAAASEVVEVFVTYNGTKL